MRLIWVGVPEEVKAAVLPHIEHWRPIVPGWLELLSVRFEETDGTNMLAITPEPEYRQAKLYVYPSFLRQPQDERRSGLLHEIIHIAYEPANRIYQSLLAAMTDDGDPIRAWAEEEHRKAMEACVTDLELGLGRLLESPNGERA
jgi:hypothetical protein